MTTDNFRMSGHWPVWNDLLIIIESGDEIDFLIDCWFGILLGPVLLLVSISDMAFSTSAGVVGLIIGTVSCQGTCAF